jgi:drug/metabolite transporter (DMT)-like permease
MVDPNCGKKAIVLVVFFIGGAFNAIFSNILYNTKALGLHNRILYFRKPIFQTWGMFVGMAIAFFNTPTCRRRRCQPYNPSGKLAGWGIFRMVSLPAMCDLAAATLLNTALLYLMPTVWQMLRGSILVFVALLSVFVRHKKLYCVDWIGIAATLVGMVVVGVSAMLEQTDTLGHRPEDVALGIGLVVLSQMIQGFQAIIEEKLTQDIDAPAIEICAYEGIWGLFVCTFVFMPVAQVLPESFGEGLFESSIESFKMVASSVTLGLLVLGYFVAVSVYNQAGIMVIALSSAIHRTIYEALRSIAIWVLALVVQVLWPETGAGERLSWYSFVRAGGFLIMVLGTTIYTRVLKLPYVYYPPEETEKEKEKEKEKAGDPEAPPGKEGLVGPGNSSADPNWKGPRVE